jgi:hypothetical protein
MAKGGKNEHRMVFDVRGKRRGVVKVVYAILAVLMGLSLFLLSAGGSLSSLFGSGSSTTSATKQFDEQAERIEIKLKKTPDDPDLLGNLTRTRVNAGNSAVTQTSTGEVGQTVESVQQLNMASAAWSEYLKATDEPNLGLAQLMSNALFTLANTSRTTAEAEANIEAATEAQEMLAKNRPSVGSWSTLALYTLYTFDYSAAEAAKKEALALMNSKFERESFENQYEEIEKRAREFQKQTKEAEKIQKEGAQANPESLENPLGGLGGSSLGE